MDLIVIPRYGDTARRQPSASQGVSPHQELSLPHCDSAVPVVWCYGSLSGLTDVQNHLYKTCFLLIPNNNSNACLQSQVLF